jgi:GT2 family glycosyltransferase
MIAFGCSITIPEVYERCAQAGIRRAAEPDSKVFAHAAAGPIARGYNLILERAAAIRDLEALVLVHQDAEIVDPELCGKLRRAFSNPQVGVVGCLGAIGVNSIAWWEGTVIGAAFVLRYGELGGGDLSLNDAKPAARTGEVDTLYGVILALSPWTVRNIRFDESLGTMHGYDFDLCLQVRDGGRKAVVEDLRLAHHHSLDMITEPEIWTEAYVLAAEKWDGRTPERAAGETDWKRRARRAEAEAAAARLRAASRLLQIYAGAQAHEDRLSEITNSLSWRVSEPLRRVNDARKVARNLAG